MFEPEIVEAAVAAAEELFMQGSHAGRFVEKDDFLDVVGRCSEEAPPVPRSCGFDECVAEHGEGQRSGAENDNVPPLREDREKEDDAYEAEGEDH